MSSSCAETNKERERREKVREGFVCGVRIHTNSDGGFRPLENPAKDILRMRNNSGVKMKENGAEGRNNKLWFP
jgi:hypothetical protein